jgi:TonB family protein
VPAGVPLDQVREVLATQKAFGGRKWRVAAIVVAALLAIGLLSVYGWREWYKASVATRTAKSATGEQSTPAGGEDANIGTGADFTSDVTNPAARPSPAIRAKATASAAITNEVVHRKLRATQSTASGTVANNSVSTANADDLPALQASGADPSDLGNALATSPALPKLGAPISQGISGGVLVHKVQPVYPPDARRMHVEGSVVINAVVTVEGKVEELQLVSGDSRLASAALEAVRQWRYTPYSLNGKPIPKQTRITISFIAPQ